MPQFLAIAAAGAALAIGYRWVRNEARRVGREIREAERSVKHRSDSAVTTLTRDPVTGVYVPEPARRDGANT